MKEEFRKLNSIHSDITRWQKNIEYDKEKMLEQLETIRKSLEDDNKLLESIKKNPQELAEVINNQTSKLRDFIFNLENTVEETEGLEINDLAISEKVIENLRSMKDQTRLLDTSAKEYLKILSLIENNGHNLKDALVETKSNVKSGLSNINIKSSEVQQSLNMLLEQLNGIALEAEALSRNKFM